MKAHVLQHVPFEGIGSIGAWLDQHGAGVTCTRFFEGDPLPKLDNLDLVIILGGPMSANDEDSWPWLRAEKGFIRDAVRQGVPTIGICLGAQLIAGALGARVYRNHCREMGWFPVIPISHGEACFRFPEPILAFHWHGETFNLPPGAIRLARSLGCENQAFQIGRNVIGLQFHLETTPESLDALVANCRGDLIPGPYTQTVESLRQVAPAAYSNINSIMGKLLSYASGKALETT